VTLQSSTTQLQNSSNGVVIQTATNLGTAFQVEDSSGAPIFLVDTTSTVNLLAYPGFEVGNPPTGWSANGGATISQNSNKAFTYHGLYSLMLTTGAANRGASTSAFTQTVTSGTYVVSFYAMLSSGTMAGNLFAITSTDGTTHTCTPSASPAVTSAGFTRISCSFTTTGNMTNLAITQTDATSRTLYIDAVQLQSGSTVSSYQIGAIQLRGVITNPAVFQSSSNSTSAFQINNAAGTNLLNVDSVNNNFNVYTANLNTTGNIQVNSSTVINSSGVLQSASLTGTYGSLTGVGTLTTGTWNASTIGVQYGGTGLSSYAVGDLLYASSTTALSKLSDVAAGSCLKSGGTGTAPTWGTCSGAAGVTLQGSTPGTPDTGNINVSGVIIAGTTLQGPSLDRSTAGLLNIGATNATGVLITPATTISNNLTVNTTTTSTSGSVASVNANLTINPSSTTTTNAYGVNGYVDATGAAMSGAGVVGINSFNEYNATGGTLGSAYGAYVGGTVDAGTITTVNGIDVGNYTGAGSVSYNTGVNISNQTKGTVSNYGLYVNGATTDSIYVASGASYFGGNTTIQTNTNSTTGFQIQNAAGANFFTADSINKIITTDDLDVGSLANIGSSARLFTDGFENGTFNQWMSGVTSAGSDSASVSTSVVRNGIYAAKFVNVGSNPGGATVTTAINTSTTLDYRAYVDIASTSSSIDILRTASASGGFTLYRDTATGKIGFYNGITSASTLGSAVLPVSGWHEIEMDITAGSSTGTVTLYLDGISVLALTGQNTGTTGFASITAGDGNSSRTNTFYIDDVSADTVRPGDSSSLNVADSLHVAGSASIGGNLVTGALAVTNDNSLINETTSVGGAYLGFISGTPRLLLADGTPTDTVEEDNAGGTFRVFNPGSTPKILVTPSGGTVINGFSTAAQFQVDNSYGGQVAAVIQGASSQTSDLLEIWSANNGTTPVAKFNTQGALTLGNTGGTTAYAGQLSFADGSTDGYTATLQTGTLTGNRTVTVQNLTGTIAILQSGAAIAQTGSINASATISAGAALQSPSLDVATAGLLSIGTSVATSLTIGNASSSATIQGSSINLGSASINLTNAAPVIASTTTNAGATIQANGTGALTLNTTGAGTVAIGTSNTTTITIGNNALTHTITIGNTTGGTTTLAGGNIALTSNTGTSATFILTGPTWTSTTRGIEIGPTGTQTSPTLLGLSNSSTAINAETAGNCTTTVNSGAMYYSTITAAIRACVNGNFEDVVTTAGIGALLFGVVPDSGTTPGDLVGIGTNGITGPCKVYVGATTSTVAWTACTAYTGVNNGTTSNIRKVNVTAGSVTTTTTTASGQFEHLCLSQVTGQPILSIGESQSTFPTTSGWPASFNVNAPQLCLADIKINTSGTTVISLIYDSRAYTTTTKQFVNVITNSPGLTQYLTPTTTPGAFTLGSAAGQIVSGIVISTTGGTTAGTINALMATAGPVAIGSTSATAGSVLIPTTYGQATTGTANTSAYTNMGVAWNSTSGSCAVNTDGCRGSAVTNLDIK
jgi:hypothetical protein